MYLGDPAKLRMPRLEANSSNSAGTSRYIHEYFGSVRTLNI